VALWTVARLPADGRLRARPAVWARHRAGAQAGAAREGGAARELGKNSYSKSKYYNPCLSKFSPMRGAGKQFIILVASRWPQVQPKGDAARKFNKAPCNCSGFDNCGESILDVQTLSGVAPGVRQVRETPTLALSLCIPTGMHGKTCIFWADLRGTPFSLPPGVLAVRVREPDRPAEADQRGRGRRARVLAELRRLRARELSGGRRLARARARPLALSARTSRGGAK
jgi:hypothetical protein